MSKPERIELPSGWNMKPHIIGEWYDIVDKAGTSVPTELTEYGALLFAAAMNAPSTRLAEAEKVIEELVKVLKEAKENMEGWQGYVSEYFKDKWGANDDLSAIDAGITRAREYQEKAKE